MIRLRTFKGFHKPSELTLEFLTDNNSFSIYRDDVQLGRISIDEHDMVINECFVESEKDLLERYSNRVRSILGQI